MGPEVEEYMELVVRNQCSWQAWCLELKLRTYIFICMQTAERANWEWHVAFGT